MQSRLSFFSLLYSMPAQKASNHRHGQPASTDIWERLSQNQGKYCRLLTSFRFSWSYLIWLCLFDWPNKLCHLLFEEIVCRWFAVYGGFGVVLKISFLLSPLTNLVWTTETITQIYFITLFSQMIKHKLKLAKFNNILPQFIAFLLLHPFVKNHRLLFTLQFPAAYAFHNSETRRYTFLCESKSFLACIFYNSGRR